MKNLHIVTVVCLCVSLALTGCSKEAVEDSLKYRMESEHFIFYSFDSDVEVLDKLGRELEGKYEQITTRLQYIPAEKIDVEVYPSVNSFHNCLGYPDSPNWAVGFAGNGKVQMVTPTNPGPAHTYESLMKAVVHEFTHIIVRGHNKGDIPIWLNEGIASYEAKNITGIQYGVAKGVREGNVPTFDKLEEEFSAHNGYQHSYTIVEFMIEDYGYDKLVELIKNPNIEAVFEITEDALYTEWVNFLEEHYQ